MNLRSAFGATYRTGRRVVIAIVGVVVVLLGVAMLVLPGPGLLTIIGGLAILALEFPFAQRWLDTIKREIRKWVDAGKRWWRRKHPPAGPPASP